MSSYLLRLFVISACAVFSSSVIAERQCRVSWYFPDDPTKSDSKMSPIPFTGYGPTDEAAFVDAHRACRWSHTNSSYRKYCNNPPYQKTCTNRSYTDLEKCRPRFTIAETLYDSGNKNSWCHGQGSDGYDPSPEKKLGAGDCIRKCPSSCVKVAIAEFFKPPWRFKDTSVHKNQFCQERGYAGAHDPWGSSGKPSGAGGYCYKGEGCFHPKPHPKAVRKPGKSSPPPPRRDIFDDWYKY